jgi:uncharacterized protein with NRDE domain
MCTLIVATGVWQQAPLLIAANRDEQLDRPSEPPSIRSQNETRFLAPLDVQGGGTWQGVNEFGVFVGITNRFTPDPDPDARSRGLLVLDALEEDTARTAVRRLMSVDPQKHNPFHMVVADFEGAHLLWSDGKRHRTERLAPGFHIVTERSLRAASTRRPALLEKKLGPLFGPDIPSNEAWKDVLRTRSDDVLEGINIRDESKNYGTRSSSIIRISPRPEEMHWLHAEGAPDEVDFDDISDAFRELMGFG